MIYGIYVSVLYSLHDEFSKVRSFVFVSEIVELPRFFEKYDIHDAINKAVSDAGIAYYLLTDYTAVFEQFYNYYYDILNSRTTIIILSDGRNNYKTPITKHLEKIKSQAIRIIRLNPDFK